jgi:N-acetylglucosamine-6-phosphate deacetylase
LRTLIYGGNILTPQHKLTDQILIIENGSITGIVGRGGFQAEQDDRVIQAEGLWVTPGLIDIHVHGGFGADTMDATPQALDRMGHFFASHGVTSYYPTTGAAAQTALLEAVNNVARYRPGDEVAVPLGVHVEGPYLSEKRKGAQPAQYLRNPNLEEYRQLISTGWVKIMTVAPELEGAGELIRFGVQQGVEFAAGHSAAPFETMQEAAGIGLRQATHTFNGMDPLHHRQPGVVGAVLSDERIYAQVIVDGIHVHPAVVKLLVRAKGIARTILITDAMRASGLPDGEYDLLGQVVTVKSGMAQVAGGSLAGSTLTLDAAVRNVMDFTGCSLPDAISMATITPAQAMGLQAKKGKLSVGADADITLFDSKLEVILTLVGGRVVYNRANM